VKVEDKKLMKKYYNKAPNVTGAGKEGDRNLRLLGVRRVIT